jgi:cyclic pyranopterin phosphate synthase
MKDINYIDYEEIEYLKRRVLEIEKKFSVEEKSTIELSVRESITGDCNFKCLYCTDSTTNRNDMSYMYWIRVNAALLALGIKDVHHTGGEPTTRKNFEEYVKALKFLGFKKQVLTTNGTNPIMIKKLLDNGITRINISLDSLEESKVKLISKSKNNTLPHILKSIEHSIEKNIFIKINTVVTKENLENLDCLFKFCQSKKLVLRLIELYPYGPSMEKDKKRYDELHVDKEWIYNFYKNKGIIQEILVEGINNVPKYFKIENYDVPVGIISPNWIDGGATCGKEKCVRLRASANGNITYCNNKNPILGHELENLSFEEIVEKLSVLIHKKHLRIIENRFPEIHPFLYNKLRFGV